MSAHEDDGSKLSLGRIHRFEKDLKSRTAIRFHLEDDAERELCTFAYSLLQLVVDSIREVEEEDSNPPSKKRKRVVSVFDIEKVLGNCKRLPGWNAVQQSRNYEGSHCYARKPNEVHRLLCKKALLVEQEDV